MADYAEKLRQDLVEQFKEKPVIDALICAIGEQLTDLHRFFTALRDERGVLTAIGKQLDGVGDIVCLSREEAGALACTAESVYVLDDEQYRDYLIFKIWKNTNNCTYHDVIKAFRMFWPKPLYYSEYPDKPATIFLRTDELSINDHVEDLLHTPIIIKAAGVGIHVEAIIRFFDIEESLHAGGISCSTVVLHIPAAADEVKWLDALRAGGGMAQVSVLPVPEAPDGMKWLDMLRTGGAAAILSTMPISEQI